MKVAWGKSKSIERKLRDTYKDMQNTEKAESK